MLENLFKNDPPITDYGNGIFRFNFRDDTFGKELSKFIKSNSNLRIISVCYEPTSDYFGSLYSGSFIIITETKN